jgi:nicotinamidase-related amidase
MEAALTPRLLTPQNALLLIVDIQGKFVPVIQNADRLIERAAILIQAADTLGIPIVVSEQYPKGLGHTTDRLTQHLPLNAAIFEKSAFGCGADPDIQAFLGSLNRKQVMVCGIEAHVCVNQTVHQLLAEGYQVHLIQDAVSSRHKQDAKTGIAKMLQSGATPSCVELALFELLGNAQHPAFKSLQALVK